MRSRLTVGAGLVGCVAVLVACTGAGSDQQRPHRVAAESSAGSGSAWHEAARRHPSGHDAALATGHGSHHPLGLPRTPAGWPTRVELGVSSPPGDASKLTATTPFGFRYQYLAGGANTGEGWATWDRDGRFVTHYIEESSEADIIPVFTYYMLRQSRPGRDMAELDGVSANLTNPRTMAAYYRDLKVFFRRAAAVGGMTVLHVEPDLWAFMQQWTSDDDPASVPVRVNASGMADVAGLPDTAAGFAQAIVQLRDRYAPNVVLAYHVSTWGTGDDVLHADPPDEVVRALGRRTAAFYRSLDATFDIAFTDIADRDAAFNEEHDGDGGAAWMDAADYRRSVAYIDVVVGTAGLRALLWQLPLGNTEMRAVNDTWNHYQDNKVESLLADGDRSLLGSYVSAGVVAFLFGRGADGATCACDAEGDGVTNPSPINGNDGWSVSADDDGGFFRARAARYYEQGAVALDE